MANNCANRNCGYYWREDGEAYPRCHYDDPWPAPCEYDDNHDEDGYDDEDDDDDFWE